MLFELFFCYFFFFFFFFKFKGKLKEFDDNFSNIDSFLMFFFFSFLVESIDPTHYALAPLMQLAPLTML